MVNDDACIRTLVLEEDWTEVDSDSFEYIEEETTFIILDSNETWKSSKGLHCVIFNTQKMIPVVYNWV